MKSFVLIFSFLLFSSQSFAGVEVNPNIEKMTENFYQTMMVCPDKIWSSFDWSGFQVLFFQKDKQVSLLWDATSNEFVEIENLIVPLEAQYGIYSFFNFQDKPTMSLNSRKGDYSESYMFSLGTHEFFHYQGQKGWGGKPNSSGRQTEYPLDGQPRFLRRMIFDHLKSYFLSGDKENLLKARYWYDEWMGQYPNEVLSTTDGYEGSAKYVDIMASALVNKSCAASDTDLKSFLDVAVEKTMGGSLSGQSFGLDAEGYDIGGLSALILRFDNKVSLSEWNQTMSQGDTALEILLEDILPMVEETPEELKDFFKNKEVEVNTEWGSYLDQDIANWSDNNFVRVSTPFSMVNGSFSPMFFALSKEINLPMFPFAVDQTFISPTVGQSDFMVLKPGVMIEDYENPCEEGPVTLIAKSDLSLAGSSQIQEVQVDMATLKGRLVGEEKVDANGMTYFCIQ